MGATNLIAKGLQQYWRFSRGLTLGAQGCIIDANGKILLIRHTYRPGWHFPGGGVERGESIHQALTREVFEETGVIMTAPPQLHGLFCNDAAFRGDHIALFVIRAWQQPEVPKPNSEIAEQAFFAADTLPGTINPPTAARIREVIEGRQAAELW